MPCNQAGEPTVTVIVPLYNKELFVAECLESILMQEVTFAYRVLIIDDGSTDASPQIIAAFQKNYPDRITIITHVENLGLYASITEAYFLLESEFYSVLDPDDFWILKTFMQDAIAFLSNDQSVNSYGGNTVQKYLGQELLYNKNTPTCYYTVEDMFRVYAITGAVFYRNTFTQISLEKVRSFQNHWKKEGFRSDLFRYLYALSSGRGYYTNAVVNCYRVTNMGLWSGLNRAEKAIEFIKTWVSVIDFFHGTPLLHILQCTRNHIKQMLALSLPEIQGNERKILFYVRQYQKAALAHGGQPLHAFCFINPSRAWDEKTVFFLNLANFLAVHLKISVYYVDYPDGIVSKEKQQYAFTCLPYERADVPIACGEAVHVFTPVSFSAHLPNIADCLSIAYWVEELATIQGVYENTADTATCATQAQIMPTQAMSKDEWQAFIQAQNTQGTLLYKNKRAYRHLQNTVCDVLRENTLPVSSLVKHFTLDEHAGFMQEWLNNVDAYALNDAKARENASNIETLDAKLPAIAPSMLPETLHETPFHLIDKETINIAYIASLDAHPERELHCLLNNLMKYKTTKKKVVHVLGNLSGNIVHEYADIKLILVTDCSEIEREKYLKEHVDIAFSHGQTLLEAAKYIIPSFLCYQHDQEYQYSYYILLPYAEGLDLTPRLENRTTYQNMHFGTLMSEIYSYGKKYAYAMRCYQYFLDHHELSSNACKLLVLCQQLEE